MFASRLHEGTKEEPLQREPARLGYGLGGGVVDKDAEAEVVGVGVAV